MDYSMLYIRSLGTDCSIQYSKKERMENAILPDWYFSIYSCLPYHKRPSHFTLYRDHIDAHPIEEFHQDPKTKKPITKMKQQNTCKLIVAFPEK
jgi:hypothetical protein